MAVTAFASGTQTATVGTEHTLASVNEAGVYTLHVDLVNLATGDIVELRVKQVVLSAGVAQVVYQHAWHGAQPTDDTLAVSMPISNDLAEVGALVMTLKQTHGTGRAFPWKALKHA